MGATPQKILYYFGAGASANVLPLARSVFESGKSPTPRISGLAHELRTFLHDDALQRANAVALTSRVFELRKECAELADFADAFGDVDTYAKYLQIIDPKGSKLSRLKYLLSAYFTIKQTVFGVRDPRYIPWLVGIMSEKKFPENVKILSWNYDVQVELAAETFNEHELNFYNSEAENPSLPLICSDLTMKDKMGKGSTLPFLHLNGVAGFSEFETAQRNCAYWVKDRKNLERVLDFLEKNNHGNSLHFAWESGGFHDKLEKDILKMITGVTIVVVIGYSFPFYNREIDKKIFDQLKRMAEFSKIYFQDPVLDGQQLKSQFGLSESITIEHIKQTTNFHIPFEY